MSKYQEALDELECNAVQWKANHKWNRGNGFVDDDGVEKMITCSKILQELVDKHIEFESRKDKLVVGSEWECVVECETYTRRFLQGIKVKLREINDIDVKLYLDVYRIYSLPTQQFLHCFKPVEKVL